MLARKSRRFFFTEISIRNFFLLSSFPNAGYRTHIFWDTPPSSTTLSLSKPFAYKLMFSKCPLSKGGGGFSKGLFTIQIVLYVSSISHKHVCSCNGGACSSKFCRIARLTRLNHTGKLRRSAWSRFDARTKLTFPNINYELCQSLHTYRKYNAVFLTN